LAETAPGVLEQIGLDQNPDCALELQIIFDDIRLPRRGRRVARLALLPKHGTEQMIAADLDVGWNYGGGTPSE
jgi:hypothetical protein